MLSFVWNPNPDCFVIPFWGHPIKWYGILFALGFIGGYFIIRKLFRSLLDDSFHSKHELNNFITTLIDRLTLFVIVGTVMGARLGHVFFYGWPYYRSHPWWEIFAIWHGGLASHGGAIGIVAALIAFLLFHRKKYTSLTFLCLLDILVVPAAFAGGCIRIGNFINQEIVGIPTKLPIGVVFLNPSEGIPGIPLHPAQLYESVFYFLTFAILFYVWKRKKNCLGTGLLSGLFFVLVFGFRFLIEFIKIPQSDWFFETASLLNVGQWLSLPFIAVGLFLLVRLFLGRNKCDMTTRLT